MSETSSGEQSGNGGYEGAFGPAEACGYAAADGGVALADFYTAPGTEVTWDAPSTDPEATAAQRAIVTDTQNNMYFLQGDTWVDVNATAANGELVATRYFGDNPMPSITVGEPLGMFGSHTSVKNVLIATEHKPADDPTLSGQAINPNNPFESMEHGVDQAQQNTLENQAQARRDEKEAALQKAEADQQKEDEAQARKLREYQLDNERRARAPRQYPQAVVIGSLLLQEESILPHAKWDYRHHPHLPGVVTNLPPGDKLLEIDGKPGELSREGERISPRSGAARATYDYDEVERIYAAAKEENKGDRDGGEAAAKAAVRGYMRAEDIKAQKSAAAARSTTYQPRRVEKSVLKAQEKGNKVKRAVQKKLGIKPKGHGHH